MYLFYRLLCLCSIVAVSLTLPKSRDEEIEIETEPTVEQVIAQNLKQAGYSDEEIARYFDLYRKLQALAQFSLTGDVDHKQMRMVRPTLLFAEDNSTAPEMQAGLFEGDILLLPRDLENLIAVAKETVGFVENEKDLEKMPLEKGKPDEILILGKAKGKRPKRKLSVYSNSRWRNPISYKLSGVSGSTIRNGLHLWESKTCLRFQENNFARGDHISFERGGGCFSSVGKSGGRQSVSIGFGCERPAVVAHEVGHALGFWHEHARPDRDTHVAILEGNVLSGNMGNFLKRNYNELSLFGIPYDIGSVMHYGPTAFGRPTGAGNLVTIQTKNSMYQRTPGQREKLSFYDVKFINTAYCSRSCRQNLPCLHNGYTDPNDCTKCLCPEGLGGTLCERAHFVSSSCGQIDLTATLSRQTLTKSGTGECYYHIKAPAGGKVIIEMERLFFHCFITCSNNHLGIKFNSDLGNSAARFCCNSDRPAQLVSETNEVVIEYHGSFDDSFSLTYRTETPSTSATVVNPTPEVSTPVVVSTRKAVWGPWGEWSACSQPCGGCGLRFRTRQCPKANQCKGDYYESERCNFHACKVDNGLCTQKFLTMCGDQYCVKERFVDCNDIKSECCEPYTNEFGFCT